MELDNVWLGNEIIVHTPKFEEQQFDKKKKGNEQYNFNWFINSLTTILNDKSKCVTYGICKD
jgi:hypothetical protein